MKIFKNKKRKIIITTLVSTFVVTGLIITYYNSIYFIYYSSKKYNEGGQLWIVYLKLFIEKKRLIELVKNANY